MAGMSNEDPIHLANASVRRIGDFVLQELIVADSMGDVYRASGPNLPQDVAIRILPTAVCEDETAQERLRQDIRKGAALQNPHLAKVFALGMSDEHPFVVMELVTGQTMDSGLRNGQHLTEREVLRLALDVTDGLAALHLAGLVHGNVKPANIVRCADGSVKLTNPGLLGPHRRDAMGGFLGAPLYIAPELIKGGEESPLSDIYSLGVTLYYLLAGLPPFRGTAPDEIFKEHLFAMVIPIGVRVPTLSLRTRELIGRMMRRDPKNRYAGCHALLQELQQAWLSLGPDPASIPAPFPAVDTAHPHAPAVPPATAAAGPPPPSNRWVHRLLMIVSAILILTAVARFAWFREYGPREAHTVTPATYPALPPQEMDTAIPSATGVSDIFHTASFVAMAANFIRINPDWHNATLGEAVSHGVTLWRQDRVTIIGDGTGLSESRDHCRYLYTTIASPYAFSLHITRIATTHPRAITGILTRGDISSAAPCVFFGFTGNGNLQLCSRRQAGGKLEVLRSALPGRTNWRPCHLKLDRYADRFRAMLSPDGSTWETFGICQATIPAESTVGIAVASRASDMMTSAECANLLLQVIPPTQR
jgi:serine/threonine-protein kinase